MTGSPFARRVAQGLERSGLTLRQLCRAVSVDPSFFSKVLSGKRTPPDDDVVRRIAAELKLDATELIVAAGRIPAEWEGLYDDKELFERVNSVATGRRTPTKTASAVARPQPAATVRPTPSFAEELL